MKHEKSNSHPIRIVVIIVVILLVIAGAFLLRVTDPKPAATVEPATMQNAKQFVSQFYNTYDAELLKEDKAGSVNLRSSALESIVKSHSDSSYYTQYVNAGGVDYSSDSSSFQNPVTCGSSLPKGDISIVNGTSGGTIYEITISEPEQFRDSTSDTSSFNVELMWDQGFKISQIYC